MTKTGLEGRTAIVTDAELRQLLVFKLDDQEYGLDIENVVQVVRMVAVTKAPKAPHFVEGMLNLRGRVIPVINLRNRFGLEPKPVDLNDHLLIAQVGARSAGLIVDVVLGVLSIPVANLDYSVDIEAEMADFVQAVGKLDDRLILILDIAKALTF